MFHQLRVTANGNALIQRIEIVVVKSQTHRQTFDNEGRKIFTVTSPLLLGVALYQFFKNILTHQRDGLFLQIFRFRDPGSLPLLFNLGRSFFGSHHAPHFIKSVHVKRQ